MKKIATLLIAFWCVIISAKAQQIELIDSTKSPVSQAVVIIKPLNGDKETIYLTDNSGLVKPKLVSVPVILMISHLSYYNYVDTLLEFPSSLQVQLINKGVKLNEVVVTSEFKPRLVDESVHPVTVINREQIDNQAATNLEQVLASQLNMRISNDPVLGSGLTLNGMSGQNIKFLVDGVPVIGRLDGNIDISQINLNNVERIEVINGPMATSYGTDASGGVINLITKQQASNKYEAGLNLMYQNTGYYNIDGAVGTNSKRSSYYLTGGRYFFDGWSPVETGRWKEWKPKEQYFGNFKYRYSGNRFILGYNLNLFHEVITNKGEPRVSPYSAYAFDEYYKTIRVTNQLNASYILNRNYSLSGTAAWQGYYRTKNTYRKDLVSLDENIINGGELQDTTNINSWMVRTVFNKLNENDNLNYQAGIDFNVENASGTRFNNETIYTGDFAVFASLEYQINSKLEVKPAIRISHNTDYKSPVVPSVMLKYDATYKTQIRFSYGKGFRAPAMKERYLYFVDINHNIRGNENLLPEYSDNFFVNVKQYLGNQKAHSVEVNGFYNDIRNMITLAQPDQASSLYTYINLGKFSTHGASLNLTTQINQLSLTTGFAYTGRYNIYSDSGDFKKYIYSPDLNAGINYRFDKINLVTSVYFKYNGKLPGYKLNEDNTISQFDNESYKFLDATIRKGFFGSSLFISTGVKNILDVTNINAVANGTAHSGGNNELAVGTGRSFFVKLQYNLTK